MAKKTSSSSVAKSNPRSMSYTWMMTLLALSFGALTISFLMRENDELNVRNAQLQQQVLELQSVQ